jgi:hypothetical protein
MENGVDPIMATKLADWSSIKILDRYAHADPSRMAEAVEGLFGEIFTPLLKGES